MTRRYHLHAPGLAYAGLTVLVGFAAVNRQNNLMFWVLGVMVSALLLSGVISGVMMQGLRVRRLVGGHGIVGEPLAVRYAVTNRNRLMPAFGIHVEERPFGRRAGWTRLMAPARAWILHVGPRETVHGDAVFWPTGRGEARFDQVRIWTTFPFGIVKKSITVSQPQHTLIYPRLYELRRNVLADFAPRGFAGARLGARTGAGDDYYGMREFRPGDPLRNIAWKRTACLDQLVCLERTTPTPPRLRVIVNLASPRERHDEERAISLAASIIYAADRDGFEVGLSVPGTGRPPTLIRRSHWHRSKMLAALAAIDLEAPRVAPPRRPPAPEHAGEVVVHPDRIDPSLGADDALHLTAAQLDGLVVRAIGWDPAGPTPAGEAAGTREEAAA